MALVSPNLLALVSVGLLSLACTTPVTGKRLPDPKLAIRAFDKHRSIESLPAATSAIIETDYYQANIEYLIRGSKRALLLDSGPGKHKIAPVVASITDLPITVIPSHLHFDHVGGLHEFSDVALIDAEDLRKRTNDGVFLPKSAEHLGWLDKDPRQPIRVTRWLQPGEHIDLGGRSVEVLLTPGHTKTSIMLYDAATPALFTGDFLYPGGLFVESLAEYRSTLAMLLERIPKNVTIYPAHNGRGRNITRLRYSDLTDLYQAVCDALDGTAKGTPADAFGIPSTAYPVSKRLHMYVLKWPSKPMIFKSGQ